MKQLTSDEKTELFIDSYNTSGTTHNFCEWIYILGNINVREGRVEDAMTEEEESKS